MTDTVRFLCLLLQSYHNNNLLFCIDINVQSGERTSNSDEIIEISTENEVHCEEGGARVFS